MDSRGKKLFYYLLVSLTVIVTGVMIVHYAVIMFPSDTREYHEPLVSSRVQRGTIYDRNGTILAYETPYYSCAVLIREIDSISETADDLSLLLSMDRQDIFDKLDASTTYALVKKRLDDAEYKQLRSAIDSGDLPGVTLEKRYGRVYPQLQHGAHVIGFTNIDNVGLAGVEYTFDRLLSPLPDPSKDITYGDDIYVTLDHRIQYSADVHCRELAEEHDPDSATVLVMDAKTGELLAWTSYPWFDLNAYNTATAEQRLNRPINSMYEPGSVFKVFSLASILAVGEANTNEIFLCDGSYTFTMPNGKSATINCLAEHGEVGPREMLKYSCNGAVASWSLQTDDDLFYEYLNALGFNAKTGIQLPGEASGMIQPVSNWSGRSKPTIAFGQELGTTALQIAAAATALTNAGELLKPRIIHAVFHQEDGTFEYPGREVVREALPPEVAANVLDMMQAGTEPGGTAVFAKRDGVAVSAKTGTAQLLDIETHTYSPDHVLASTLAILPADDPKYIIYVSADNPKGGQYYGSRVAAPTIEKITSDLVSMGLLTSDESEILYLSDDL